MPRFHKGDLVWAKMKGFPPWPGKIVDPPPEIKRPSQANKKPFYCVYFYGSENYAWMLEDTIKNYAEYREKFNKAIKPSQLKDAIEKTELVFQSQILFKKRDNDDFSWQDNGYLSGNITSNLPSIKDELEAIRSTNYKRKSSSNASDTSKISDKIKVAHNHNNSENNSTFNGSDTDPLDDDGDDGGDFDDDIDSYPIGEPDFAKMVGNVGPPDAPESPASGSHVDDLDAPASPPSGDVVPATPVNGVVATKNLKVVLERSDAVSGPTEEAPRRPRRVVVPPSARDIATRNRGGGTARRARPYTTPQPTSRGRRGSSTGPARPGRPPLGSSPALGRKPATPSNVSSSPYKLHQRRTPGMSMRGGGGNLRGGRMNRKTEPLLKPTPAALLTPPDSSKMRAFNFGGSGYKRAANHKEDSFFNADDNNDVTMMDSAPSDLADDEASTNALQNIRSRSLKFGFLGTGIMGKQIVHTLLNSGHQVTVWNRDPTKCEELITSGANAGLNPADVISTCNIIFCCFSEHQALRKILLNDEDIIKSLKGGKGIVNLSTNSYRLASDISEVLTSFGSKYLEAPLFGSHLGANASLMVLAAGDQSLYHECEPLFKLIGKPLYLGGNESSATKVALILKSLQGTLIASLAEAFSLSEKAGINPQDILSILQLSMMDCPLVRNKGKEIIEGLFLTSLPLKHQQHDIKLTLDMADGIEQPTPLLSTANELFKRAKSLGCGNSDVTAVHKAFYL